jgi:SOS response regulatory protein OraA/RecX
LGKILKNKSKGSKKRGRALALKLVKALGGNAQIRRAELVQHLQAQDYSENEIDAMLKGLHSSGVLKCGVGRYSDAHVA